MPRGIVVHFRMSPEGMSPGPEGSYLARARSLCIRGEAVGGYLVAWSATSLALGWDSDSIEEAVEFAASIRDESMAPERAWACGLAEGELESLSADGEGILAWGPALLAATSLSQLARAGEVLVDAQVCALGAGQLSLRGVRSSADVAQSVRGWRLDLERPWKVSYAAAEVAAGEPEATPLDSGDLEPPAPSEDVNAVGAPARSLVGKQSGGAVYAIAELRRARARAEGGPVSTRCHASLALALALSVAGRSEEALLEALDALARARESHEPKAIGACMALLSKLYAGVGYWEAATALRDSAVTG